MARRPKARKIPLGVKPEELVYELRPLDDEEKRPLPDGGGAELARFKGRMLAVRLMDEYLPDFYKISETLFYKGGKLSAYGLKPKEGLDEALAFEVLSAMFRSPFPNHIQKEATVALALLNWYDIGEREDTENEPSFPVFFRPPGRQEVGAEVLVGKNRN